MEGSDKQAMEVTHIAHAIGIASSQIALQGASTLINIESATPKIAIEGISTGIDVQGTSTGRAFQGTSTTIAHEGTSSEKGMGKRKRMGRQKIKMEKMENETNLQVTFSKRKKGIFKKAHELAIMTGAEVAFIVFSTARKVYSYGSPNVEGVIERFTAGVSRPLNYPDRVMKYMKNQKILETGAKLEELMKQLKIKEKHGESLNQQLAQIEFNFWDTDNQDPVDLQRSIEMLQKVKNVVAKEIDKQSTTMNCMYYSGEGILPPMHVYAGGKGSGSGASGSRGDFFRFTARAGGSRVGSGGSGLEPYHPCSEFYGVGAGCFSIGVGPSAFHGVGSSRGPYTVGHSSYLDGAGSGGGTYAFGGAGTYAFGGVGSGGGGFPNAMPDIGGAGGYINMSSSSGGPGGGLSIKDEPATSGDENGRVGESNMMSTNWSDVMPPMGFGRRN